MDGLLQEIDRAPDARAPGLGEVRAICALLEDHKGGDVIALDLRELHSWTDYFIIATVTSNAHMEGLLRHIKDYAGKEGLTIHGGRHKNSGSGGWELIDMGMAIIHLMSAQSREFYELEELWLSAGKIYP